MLEKAFCWDRCSTPIQLAETCSSFHPVHMFRSQDLTKRRTIDPSNFAIFVVDEETKLAVLSQNMFNKMIYPQGVIV